MFCTIDSNLKGLKSIAGSISRKALIDRKAVEQPGATHRNQIFLRTPGVP